MNMHDPLIDVAALWEARLKREARIHRAKHLVAAVVTPVLIGFGAVTFVYALFGG